MLSFIRLVRSQMTSRYGQNEKCVYNSSYIIETKIPHTGKTTSKKQSQQVNFVFISNWLQKLTTNEPQNARYTRKRLMGLERYIIEPLTPFKHCNQCLCLKAELAVKIHKKHIGMHGCWENIILNTWTEKCWSNVITRFDGQAWQSKYGVLKGKNWIVTTKARLSKSASGSKDWLESLRYVSVWHQYGFQMHY